MNMTKIKRVFAAVMAAAMLPIIPSVASAEENPILFVNETFDSYVTNSQPEELDINCRNWFITEYEEKNKGLYLHAERSGAKAVFSTGGSKDTVISFDIKATTVMPSGDFSVYSSNGTSLKLMSFMSGRGAGAPNGLPISGFGKSRLANYVIVYRATEKKVDIYINGRKKIADMKLASAVPDIQSFAFNFTSTVDEGQGVIIDNINVYNDDEYSLKKFPVNDYNAEAEEPIEIKVGKNIGSSILLNEKFDSGKHGTCWSHANGSLSEIQYEPDTENYVWHYKREATGDSHLNSSGATWKTDVAVLEMDIYVLEPKSKAVVQLKDTNAQFQSLWNLTNLTMVSDAGSIKLKERTWYRISTVQDTYDRMYTIYVDGKLIGSFPMLDTFWRDEAGLDTFRFHVPTAKDVVTEPGEVYVDNYRIYEAEKPIEGDDLGEIAKTEIDLTARSVFPRDTTVAKSLNGYTAIHGTSGCVWTGNKKYILVNTPYDNANGEIMYPAEELAGLLKLPCEINGTNVIFNNKSYDGELKDGVVYITEASVIQGIGKVPTRVPAALNANMVIFGNSEFTLPESSAAIENLNNILLYYRPEAEDFKNLYENGPVKGVHPRVQFTQADFDRMVELSKTDPQMKAWAEQVIKEADSNMEQPMYKHELYDGLRLGKQRELSKAVHSYAVAWHLTKDQKYVDRCYAELETFASWPDWNPGHHLDVGEALAAYTVAYDWMYHGFTPEQRAVIEDGVYRNGFYDCYLAYTTTGSKMGSYAVMTNNHGTVDNTGTLMAAIGFADVYPELCYWLGAEALKCMGLNIYQWGPQGFWYEGAGYWELTMQFTAKWLDTLDTAFNTDLGMSRLDGLSEAALAELQTQTPNGIYNFADAEVSNIYVPEMLYLANKYQIPGVYEATIAGRKAKGKWADDEDLALAMMWYDPEMVKTKVSLPIDYDIYSIDSAMLRDSWETDTPTVVGIHGGDSTIPHAQLDSGSFIFESDGIRWGWDMGSGDYNSEGYWQAGDGGKRWMHYRSRAEAHSTIIVNPSEKEDHNVRSVAELEFIQQKPRGVILEMDMTEVLHDQSSAKRGFAFCDNRQSLVVRDEITLNKSNSDVYSMFITKAKYCEMAPDGKSCILTYNGQQLKIEWESNAPIVAEFGEAVPLPTTPKQTDNYKKGTFYRLQLHAVASGNFELTVKYTPMTVAKPSSISEWNKPISTWNISDGEIPTPPQIPTITIDGEVFEAGENKTFSKSVLLTEDAVVPTVTVDDKTHDVEIVQGDLYTPTKVIVTDRGDDSNGNVYTVVWKLITPPPSFEGKTTIPVYAYEVSAEPQVENPGQNMFDNDYTTRWSADGVNNWILLDLREVQRVDEVMLAFMSGSTRHQYLEILVSQDGNSWTSVFNGQSCGSTEDLEAFQTGGVNCRYIKVLVKGNSSGGANWNSVTELVVARKN